MRDVVKYFKENPEEMKKYNITIRKNTNIDTLCDRLLRLSKCSDTPFPILNGLKYNSKKGVHKK